MAEERELRREPEEEPAADERLLRVSRRLLHDVEVGRVEAEGGGRKSVSDQVHPQQLHGDKSFGHTEGGSEEDADDLWKEETNQ